MNLIFSLAFANVNKENLQWENFEKSKYKNILQSVNEIIWFCEIQNY